MAAELKNPWLPENWNLTEQSLFVKKHGRKKADEFAKAAGSFVGATAPPGPKEKRKLVTTIVRPVRNLDINQNRDVRTVGANAPADGDVLTWDASALPAPGQWVPMAPSGGGGGGAPVAASYLVLGLHGSLTSERVFTPGHGLDDTDGGANGTYTLDVDESELDHALLGNSGTATGHHLSTTTLAEGTNLYFTDERVDDRVAALIQDGVGLSWTYDDPSNTLTGDVSLAPFSTDDLAEGANLYFTDERAQDAIGTILVDSATIDFTYNDGVPSVTAETIPAGILAQLLTVDGSGSGLDADLLDGLDSSAFALAAHDHDLVYLRLDTANDPLSGDLDFGGNNAENVGAVLGGGLAAGFLILNPDDTTTVTAGNTRATIFDAGFTANNSGTWAGALYLAESGVVYSADGASGSPIFVGAQFGLNGGSPSVIQLTNCSSNQAQCFLFQHRQRYRSATAGQRINISSLQDEPTFDISGASGGLIVSYGGIQSAPQFRTTGGGGGTGTLLNDVMHQFIASIFSCETGWTLPERRGFTFALADVSGGGTITDETAFYVEEFIGTGTRKVLYSPDDTGESRHAGAFVIGQDTAPDAELLIVGDGQYDHIAHLTEASTATSGTLNMVWADLELNPAASSSLAATGVSTFITVPVGNAEDFTSTIYGVSSIIRNRGDGDAVVLTAINGGAELGQSGTDGASSSLRVSGVSCYASHNSAGASTLVTGVYSLADHSGPGTGGILAGFYADMSNANSGLGIGALSNLRGVWVSLSGVTQGTITNASGLYIEGFSSGPTYSNTPAQILLLDGSATHYGIRQQGANENRLQGSTTIGADATPSATLDVRGNSDFNGFYIDIDQIAAPSNPAAGTRRLFVNSATGEISVRTSAGTTVSLEGGGGSYTDEEAQDAVGGILVDSSTIDFTYNDGVPSITATVIQSGLDHGSIGGLNDDDHTHYILVDGTRRFTGNVLVDNQGDLRLYESGVSSTNYTGFQAPASLSADVLYTLPSADATASGQHLTSNASGTMSWSWGRFEDSSSAQDLTRDVSEITDVTCATTSVTKSAVTSAVGIQVTGGGKITNSSGASRTYTVKLFVGAAQIYGTSLTVANGAVGYFTVTGYASVATAATSTFSITIASSNANATQTADTWLWANLEAI